MSTLPRKSYDAGYRGPLAGIRIIDLSRLVAGNMLTLQLGDFGADVIKIEPLAGDTLRAFRTADVETYWKVYARNKRSVCLDFRSAAGRKLILRLCEEADVLVESFRPGVMEEMGLSPAALLARNARLVVMRLSGWGQTGAYREKPGFGTLVEGYSGFAAMNGFSDREPVLPPMFLGDMTTGLYGATAVMTALWEVRVNGGVGQVIDLSLFEPTLSMLGPQAANFKLTGRVKARTGSRSSTTAPRNAYRTGDDQWLCISTSTHSMAHRLFEAIGHGDMNTDARYATNVARLAHVEDVDRVVGAFVGARTLAQNLAFFEAAGVTAGPIYDASHLSADDYVIGRESLVELEDEDIGSMPMHNVVARLSGTPGGFKRPAPRKGEHTAEVLLPLCGADHYEHLLAEGVVLAHPARDQTPPHPQEAIAVQSGTGEH
ncbi:CaiB/BaiF CoA transferase family protein [Schauerella aestuarii]|uniref:CaiB/BaiF CoA transferase family protein n=1 Tax=Schauerella aestuarii TaxID=2511204 RepID=UPI00136EF7E6|nr:CoA transferase [Achromobacter aestuarii]